MEWTWHFNVTICKTDGEKKNWMAVSWDFPLLKVVWFNLLVL